MGVVDVLCGVVGQCRQCEGVRGTRGGGGCAVRRARLQELNRGEIGASVRPLTADGREGSIEEDGIGDAPGTEDALAVRHGDGGPALALKSADGTTTPRRRHAPRSRSCTCGPTRDVRNCLAGGSSRSDTTRRRHLHRSHRRFTHCCAPLDRAGDTHPVGGHVRTRNCHHGASRPDMARISRQR